MRFVCIVALVLATITSASAQEDVLRPKGRPGDDLSASSSSRTALPFIIGIEGGANFNFFSQDIAGTFDESPYNVYGSGFGVSPLFGIYLDLPVSASLGFGMRVLYDVKTINNTQDQALLDCFIDGAGYTVAPISAEYTESVSYVTINPLIRWQATPQLFIHLGPVLQFAATQVTNTTTYRVDESEECRFNYGTPDESTSLTLEGSTDADPSSRFGLDFGLGYRIPLTSSIDLVPRIGYQLMFSPYSPDVVFIDDSRSNTIGAATAEATNSTLSSLQLSISLWFNL